MSWDRDKERKAGKAMTVGSCIYGIVFVVIWCAIAAAMGAWFMLLFGIPFLGFMIFRLVICVRKMNEQKREADPWEQQTRPREPVYDSGAGREGGFCPYCGEEVKGGFVFCPKCGRRL